MDPVEAPIVSLFTVQMVLILRAQHRLQKGPATTVEVECIQSKVVQALAE